MNQQTGPTEDVTTLFQSPQIIEKHFSYHEKPIYYVNRASIKQNQDQGKGILKVRNVLCRKQNQKLIKITQILFEDRIITITDEFFPGDGYIKSLKFLDKKSKSKHKYSHFGLIEQGFMVSDSSTAKSRSGILSKMYRNILKMYMCWLSCFQNLSAQEDMMKSIIKKVKKYTLSLLHDMKNKPNIVDSFKKFVSCNSQNLHNISKQNSRQNYLMGTTRMVKFFQEQQKISSSQILIPKKEQIQHMEIQIKQSKSMRNIQFQQESKKEVEQSGSGIDRQKTNFSFS